MMILAVEASATACSVALCENERLIAQNFLHSGLTHSVTLLPMISTVLESSEKSLADLDLLAVASGPGSFTGLRIAVSAVKGLAWAKNIPCVGCSTLGSMAWHLAHMEGAIVIPVMDARRNQVYSGIFSIEEGKPKRLLEDTAIAISDLAVKLNQLEGRKILVGDGASLCYSQLEQVEIAPPHLRLQQAWGVAQEAQHTETVSCDALLPEYHRLSQAERERLEKQGIQT